MEKKGEEGIGARRIRPLRNFGRVCGGVGVRGLRVPSKRLSAADNY